MDTFKSHLPTRGTLLLLLIAFAVLWFSALGYRPLVKTDEGRYAEMAREMVATGDWITPRLNGLKYFEKPPLQTWMNALTFKLFGLGDWQARLWTGLCGFIGILLTGLAGSRLFNPRTGIFAAMILAASLWWSAMGHINTLDMGLSAMMTLTLCALLIAQQQRYQLRQRNFWMRLCWAGMALAVLSKGLIGVVLPGAVLVLYLLWSRDWALLKNLNWLSGLFIFFAICTPWFVAVSLANPEFPQFFFIHEHFQRFLTKVHHRDGPLWYFIPLLVIGLIPWLGWLPSIIKLPLKETPQQFQAGKLLLLWFVFIFVFFSVSSSKLPSYILPVFPALALLIAYSLDTAQQQNRLFRFSVIVNLLVSGVGLFFVFKIERFASTSVSVDLLRQYQPWLYAALIVLLLTTILYSRAFWHNRFKAVSYMTLGGLFLSHAMLFGFTPLAHVSTGTAMLPLLRQHIQADTPLYMVQTYDQTMPFYLQRTFTLVEHADEMAFGVGQEPERWLPTMAAFKTSWLAQSHPIALMPPATYDTLLKEGWPMVVIARDQRRVFVGKPALTPLPNALSTPVTTP